MIAEEIYWWFQL